MSALGPTAEAEAAPTRGPRSWGLEERDGKPSPHTQPGSVRGTRQEERECGRATSKKPPLSPAPTPLVVGLVDLWSLRTLQDLVLSTAE